MSWRAGPARSFVPKGTGLVGPKSARPDSSSGGLQNRASGVGSVTGSGWGCGSRTGHSSG